VGLKEAMPFPGMENSRGKNFKNLREFWETFVNNYYEKSPSKFIIKF